MDRLPLFLNFENEENNSNLFAFLIVVSSIYVIYEIVANLLLGFYFKRIIFLFKLSWLDTATIKPLLKSL